MSKNVKVNGVDYTGVSQVQLPTTAGGTALFKDVDEITEGGVSIWEGYQHTMQVAPIPYIIDQCEKATAKGTLTPTAAVKGTTELVDTGLSAVHFFFGVTRLADAHFLHGIADFFFGKAEFTQRRNGGKGVINIDVRTVQKRVF